VEELNKSYDEYIEPSLLYFTQDPQGIAKALGVKRVIPMGQYIRGLLGGETGRGEPYAGLILEEYRYDNNEFEFRLYGTKTKLRVPKDWLQNHFVNVYKLVYVGMINPFRLLKLLPTLLSSRGAELLRDFLRQALNANAMKLTSDDMKKISTLITELQQPSSLETLNEDAYYVVYRRSRIFSATVLKPESNSVLYDDVAAVECLDEKQAYYYAAVLNYIAYKVKMKKRSFIHHQYARPALAIVVAGLSWKDIDAGVRNRVVELSKQLGQKVPLTEFPNQRVALNHIAKYVEFKELVKILDESVEEKRLNEALNLVSGTGSRQSKR
jgi:hypothetical protein